MKLNNVEIDDLLSRWSWIDTNPDLMVPFFKEILIPKKNRVPSKSEVIDCGYSGFLTRIQRMKNYSWEKLVIDSGHIPISGGIKGEEIGFTENEIEFFKKYKIDKNQLVFRYDWLKSNCKLAKSFIDDVFLTIFRKIPNRNMLRVRGFGGFPKALKKICKKTYLEVIEDAGYEYYIDLRFSVGIKFHLLFNDALTLFFKYLGIKYYPEPNVYPSVRPDGLLLIEEPLLEILLKNQIAQTVNLYSDLFLGIKVIILDITSDLTDSNLIEKILKYQRPDVFFFIIGYKWPFKKSIKTIPTDSRILYPQNVRIISINFFMDLLNMSTIDREKIEYLIQLTEVYDLETLKKEPLLDRDSLFRKDDLKKDLKARGLIEENISEYLDFGKREYFIKNSWTDNEINYIKSIRSNSEKIAIIDIETTGFSKKFDKVVEIGIVELDIKTKEYKILFNSPVYEQGVEIFIDNEITKKYNIDIKEILEACSLESFRDILQLIFNCYRITAYNINFDLNFLESRGFEFPMAIKDIMGYAREILPKNSKYTFQYTYNYFYNSIKNGKSKYLSERNYIEQHMAIDDAIYEAELLYFLYYEYKFPLSYQKSLS